MAMSGSPPKGFNPRSRAGSDGTGIPYSIAMHVSIRAPARGATTRGRHNPRPRKCFNPRSRAGSDANLSRRRHARTCFNPRSRAGSDIMAVLAAIIILVSIRAPARGATSRGTYYIKQELFQSALPRGERRRTRARWHRSARFNPRSRAGSDT